MTTYGIWNGGYGNYAPSEVPRDVEQFDTIEDACQALESRYVMGHSWLQTFNFVNRPTEHVYTPVVGVDTSISLFAVDPSTFTDWSEPDWRIVLEDECAVISLD